MSAEKPKRFWKRKAFWGTIAALWILFALALWRHSSVQQIPCDECGKTADMWSDDTPDSVWERASTIAGIVAGEEPESFERRVETWEGRNSEEPESSEHRVEVCGGRKSVVYFCPDLHATVRPKPFDPLGWFLGLFD